MANKDDVMALISALRAETEESSLTPDRVGYVLELMLSLLDGYADTVSVGVIRQEVDRALREVAALQAENLSQAEELTRLLGILTRLSNVVQVNGRQLDILSSRVSSNTDRIAALEDSRPDPSVGSVTDVKLDGHSVVNNNGVASLRTPGFLDIKGYVTIHHVMIQTLQDALNALNLYCTENEFDIEQLKARPNIIFGQMDGSTFYDLDDNAVTPDDNSLYIDISADKLYRWNGTAFVEVSGVRITDVPFLENPNTSTPDVFGIYKSFADYYAWVGDHQTSHMMTVGALLDYIDNNIGKVVLLLDSASSPEYVQVLSVAGGIPSTTSPTNIVELSSQNNNLGLSISIYIERNGTLTGYTVTAERKTGLKTSSYNGQTKVSETSISAAGVISQTANNATKTFNLPSTSGTLALKEETLPAKTYAPLEFSGLGRKYLQKNIVSSKNVLTQAMVNDANTVYVVQYDYDLNEQSITVPAGCVLKFDGGSISNGTIVGNGTIISADSAVFEDITLSGTFKDLSVDLFVESEQDVASVANGLFGITSLVVFGNKAYSVTSPLNIKGSVSAKYAVFNLSSSGKIVIGTGSSTGDSLHYVNIELGRVHGDGNVATGIEIDNLASSTVTAREVDGFTSKCVYINAQREIAYNTFVFGHVHNAPVLLDVYAPTNGWVNQNYFRNTRFSNGNTTGYKAIVFETPATYSYNLNVIECCSFESIAGSPVITLNKGNNNIFRSLRFEGNATNVFSFDNNSFDNVIENIWYQNGITVGENLSYGKYVDNDGCDFNILNASLGSGLILGNGNKIKSPYLTFYSYQGTPTEYNMPLVVNQSGKIESSNTTNGLIGAVVDSRYCKTFSFAIDTAANYSVHVRFIKKDVRYIDGQEGDTFDPDSTQYDFTFYGLVKATGYVPRLAPFTTNDTFNTYYLSDITYSGRVIITLPKEVASAFIGVNAPPTSPISFTRIKIDAANDEGKIVKSDLGNYQFDTASSPNVPRWWNGSDWVSYDSYVNDYVIKSTNLPFVDLINANATSLFDEFTYESEEYVRPAVDSISFYTYSAALDRIRSIKGERVISGSDNYVISANSTARLIGFTIDTRFTKQIYFSRTENPSKSTFVVYREINGVEVSTDMTGKTAPTLTRGTTVKTATVDSSVTKTFKFDTESYGTITVPNDVTKITIFSIIANTNKLTKLLVRGKRVEELLGGAHRGDTASRPFTGMAGYLYFDTTLGKYIYWDGSAWVNLDGTALS